jgi:hypothetical protein
MRSTRENGDAGRIAVSVGVRCGLCALLIACGGGKDRPPISDTGGTSIATSGGGNGAGGSVGAGGSGGAGGSSGSSVGAPVVKVTSPTPLTAPTVDGVLVGDTVSALCTATTSNARGARPVDPASVKIAVLDASGHVATELPGTPTNTVNEYKASFVVTTVPNGVIMFRCTASDTSMPPVTGSDNISTFIDHGPDIAVTTPAANAAYPLAGAVPFHFSVTPAPLAPNDTGAGVTSVSLNVNGVDIPVTPDSLDPTSYKMAVDFNNTTLFPQPPTGSLPVEIKAKDSRMPVAAERVQSYHFTVDGAGPVVTLKKPKDQDIIGGKVTMEFSVVDALTGVDPTTVSVELNQSVKRFSATDPNWTVNKNDYTYTFDSANVAGSKVQVTVNITASDIAGNKAAGESVILYLDNFPPIVDLNPGNVRQTQTAGGGIQCSESFDPLGSAASDGDTVQPFALFRALVWDKTNSIAGQKVFYYSFTDPNSVYLYLQPDGATVPLLVNNDADPECDALNIAPGGKAIPSLRLNPVTPAGSAFYNKLADPAKAPAIPGSTSPACTLGTDSTPPAALCTQNASDLTVVIRHDAANTEPVIYGIGSRTGLECTGTGWELPSQLSDAIQKEGWFCLAAVASDNVGNTAISPPLRICYDDKNTPFVPLCAMQSQPPPSCTDGCTPPSGFAPSILATH